MTNKNYIVYLIKNDCIKGEPHKIGFSSLTVYQRCYDLSRAAKLPNNFEPVFWIDVENKKIAERIESELHNIFKSNRDKNNSEWFYILEESALQVFKTYAKLYKTSVKFPEENYKELYKSNGKKKSDHPFDIYEYGAKNGDKIICKTKNGEFEGILNNKRIAYNGKSYSYGKFVKIIKGIDYDPPYKTCLYWNGKRFDKLCG